MSRLRRSRVLSVFVATVATVAGVATVATAASAATAPAVTKVSPAKGPATGGTRVTVTGHGFRQVRRVDFQARPGTALHVISSTKLTVRAPSHDAGTVHVRVVTAGGTSTAVSTDHFSFVVPVITGISPPAGLPRGGNTVRIVGTGLGAITRVLFGSVASTRIHKVSGTDIRVVAPKHGAGAVHVRVTGSHGTSVANTAGRYRFTAAPTAPKWRAAKLIDPNSGELRGISCPTSSFCAAVDNGNHLLTRNVNGTWRRQSVPALPDRAPFPPQFNDVSCASPTLCLASSFSDNLTYRWNGTGWTLFRRIFMEGLSCMPGTNRCLAAGGTGSYDYNNGVLTTHPVNDQLFRIACASPTFCAAAGNDFGVRTFNGTSWSTTAEPVPVNGLFAVLSCAAPQFCAGVQFDGKASVRTAPGSWTTLRSVDPGVDPADISCGAPSSCVVIDNAGRYLTYTGTWSAPKATGFRGTPLAISCFAAMQCRATDDTGAAYLFDGSTWSGPETVEAEAGTPDEVSCVSRTFCMTVDLHGNALRWNGTTWTAPTQIANHHPLRGVSCATTRLCIAVGAAGTAVRWNGTSWAAPTKIDAAHVVTSVSCAPTTLCMAVDDAGNALAFRNGTWSAPKLIDRSGHLSDVSCPITKFCLAVDAGNGVRRFDGAHWHGEAVPAHDTGVGTTTSIECPSSGYCMLGGSSRTGAVVLVRNGTTWEPVGAATEFFSVSSISCTDRTFCLGTAFAGDGGDSFVNYGAATRPSIFTNDESHVSCTSGRFCALIVDNTARVTA